MSVERGTSDEESDEQAWARQRRAAQRIMNTAAFCPKCGRVPEYESCGLGWNVTCTGCYDGAEDAGPQFAGSGQTLAQAVAHWNECVEENSPLTCACGHSSDIHVGSGCGQCGCADWQPKEVAPAE